MLRTISAIATVAALAAATLLLPAMTPEVVASHHDPLVKVDRADHVPTCERQGWPYYQAGCLRDEHRNAGRVPAVRMITTDHVKVSQPATPTFEPVATFSAADRSANPLAVPAWPEYLGTLQVML